jgi:hypothetical protein
MLSVINDILSENKKTEGFSMLLDTILKVNLYSSIFIKNINLLLVKYL